MVPLRTLRGRGQNSLGPRVLDMPQPELDGIRPGGCRQLVEERFPGERPRGAIGIAQVSGAQRRRRDIQRRNDMPHRMHVAERVGIGAAAPLDVLVSGVGIRHADQLGS
jgi:hypothetical protein